jgi:hypothetical protein
MDTKQSKLHNTFVKIVQLKVKYYTINLHKSRFSGALTKPSSNVMREFFKGAISDKTPTQ